MNITNIPAPRVPFIDERTGLMAREWYRFFLNLFVLTGSGNNPITLEELQLGPPNQPDFTELLIQINKDIAPQYEDQSGDFLATLDTAQLMSMMSQFANAEAAIQGAYLQPVVQTGTIANYNLDGSPTAGGIAYGTGPALAVSAAGTLGQVLTSAGAGTPTWSTAATGSVTSVSVVSANGLAGTVATATTTPAITLSTTITGLLKGNGTAISAATSGTDYAPATSGTSILYGNGSGGFSNVTIGTGVAFAGGTLSATGSGGTVTSVAALTLGTTGTDLSSTVATGTTTPVITLQVPTASAANRGALSAADWTTFNNKGSGTVTSVAQSFTGGLISVAGSPITTSGTLALTVAGTSGGIPYFSSASTWATSALLTNNAIMLGGGAAATPKTTTTGTGVVTALGVNTGTAGAFVVNGGALGSPSSAGTIPAFTLGGTVAGGGNQLNNVIIGTTTPLAGAFTTVTATGTLSVSGASTLTGITSVGGIPNAQPTPASTLLNLIGTGTASTTVPQARINLVVSTNQDYSTWIGGIHGNAIGTDPRILLGSRIAGTDYTHATFALAGATISGTLSATGVVTFSNYGVGTATFSAAGVISSVSDETWKIKDGAPVDTDAMLNKLEPGYWYYNDEKKDTFGADRQLGFYAQNVNAAIGPEAAPEPEEGKPWGYYDRSVLAVTVMSLQKALATIESLTARIAALEAK